MYTQITVQAKQLRAGDTFVGCGVTVNAVRKGVDGWVFVDVGDERAEGFRPTEHFRVVREVRP